MSENNYVLACVNGLPPSDLVIDYATWLSGLLDKQLKLFHTIDEQYHDAESNLSGNIGLGSREKYLSKIVAIEHEQNKLLQQKAQLILDDAQEKAQELGADKIDLCLRKGRLIENLIELQDKIAVAVIGKYGKHHQSEDGSKSSEVGHNVEALIKSLDKPVLVVNEPVKKTNCALLAYDGSKASQKALEFIASHPGFAIMEMHIVYVGEQNTEILNALETAEKKLTELSYNFKIAKLDGDVISTIREYVEANNISLMITGAFGHNWLHDLVKGSLTSKMIKECVRPILMVR